MVEFRLVGTDDIERRAMRDLNDKTIRKFVEGNLGRIETLPDKIVEVTSTTFFLDVAPHCVLITTLRHKRIAIIQFDPLKFLVVSPGALEVQLVPQLQPEKRFERQLRTYAVKYVERSKQPVLSNVIHFGKVPSFCLAKPTKASCRGLPQNSAYPTGKHDAYKELLAIALSSTPLHLRTLR